MRRKAFTLIELLVVISIIALLLSVLVPSLSLAKERAMEVLCETNIRQYGLGMVMYCNDNDNKFANSEDWLYLDFTFTNYPRSVGSLRNFDCVWHNAGLSPDGLITEYLSNSEVSLCPLFRRTAKLSECAKGWSNHNPDIPIEPMFSYSQNAFLGVMRTFNIPDRVGKITNVRSPSTVFAYAEENPFVIPANARPQIEGLPLFKSVNTPLNDCLMYIMDPRTARTRIEGAGGKHRAELPFVDCFGSFHGAKDSEKYLGSSKAVFVDGHIQDVVPEESILYSWPF
jgi:prepilin-type N-terminal cleavage/methylation domain-containing protein